MPIEAPSRRIAAPIQMSFVRELTREDLLRLSDKDNTGVPPLKKPRAIHHKQAQLIAEGFYTNLEIAAICGTSAAHLSVLKQDPAFQELIALYSDQRAEIEFETAKRVQTTLTDILELASNEIQERLSDENSIKKIPLSELRKTAEFAADRSIAPPRATQQGSAMPPTKIELNFGYKPREAEPKLIEAVQSEDE